LTSLRVKSLASISILTMLLLGGGIASSQANPAVGELSAVGERAFEDITTCLTSGKDKALDVFYLIDNSGSLTYTDVNQVRTEVLANSLEGLASFSAQGIKVSYAAALFNTNVEPIQGWTELSSAGQSSTIADYVNNSKSGGWTDWEEGLTYAQNELNSRTGSCKMLIWFTDGGINPNGSQQAVFSSLANLCRSDLSASSLGSSGGYGLFDSMRKAQISVFGVLYQNDQSTLEAFQGEYGSNAQNRLDLEHYLMSFMVPLIEGKGEVGPQTSFWNVPSPGPVQCGDLDEAGFSPAGSHNGAFLNAKDPVSLAFQFLKLQSQISGGSGVAIVDGKFVIKPGTAAFRIITSDPNWQLTGPEGSEIQGSAANPGELALANSAGVQTIDFDVRRQSQYLGEWAFDFDPAQRAELYVYSGLTIELDRDKVSQVISDRENTLTGQIIPTSNFRDLPVDLKLFEQKNLSLEILTNGVRENADDIEIELSDSGQFKITKFKPSQATGDFELWITLTLGGDFQPVASRFTLGAIEASALAVPASDVFLLTTLEGPSGVATGTITLLGPTTSESSDFCLAGSDLRTDDAQTAAEKVDRMSGFAWSFDGQAAAGSDVCFTVGKDETKEIQVEVTNPTQANSQVVSIRSAVSKYGQAEYSAPLRFEFETKTQGNTAVTIAVIALLLLLGILVPLMLLYLFNKLTTRFLPLENTYRAEYPIAMTPGLSPKISDARGQGTRSGIEVGPQDFVAQVDQPAAPEINTGLGMARGRVPLIPILATWYEIQALEGQRVITMKSGGEKNPKTFSDGKSSELSPNMNENWALSFSDADLLKSDDTELPGRLVVFAAMSNLPAYQSRINDILQTPGIADRVSELRAAVHSEELDESKKPKTGRSKPEATNDGASSVNTPIIPTSLPGTGKMAPPSLPSATPDTSGPASATFGDNPAPQPPKPASGKLAPPPPPSI
jgi:hypothetical protein